MIIGIFFIILLLAGVPVAFSLGIPALAWLLIHPGMPMTSVAQNMMKYMLSFTIISMPGFLLVGRLMNSSGITDRLLRFAVAVVGRLRGGLVYANALASMMFATMSGTAIGDAGGLGLVEMKMMKDAGYKPAIAAGITASSSILGPIIPPSSIMVMLGAVAEVSTAALFYAGVVPGVIMAGSLMGFIFIRSMVTAEGKSWPTTKLPLKESLKTIPQAIPAMMTFVIILGSIMGGIATCTEAAILAVWWAIFLGIVYKKLTWKKMWKTLQSAVSACGVFMLIMAVASYLAWIFTIEGLPQFLRTFLASLAGNNEILMLLICAGIFLLIGCFLDTGAAALILAPILFPVVRALGIDVVHFGIVMTIGLMIGIITPPFGICLFVVAEVGNVPVRAVTKESVRYIPAMVVTLLLVILFPDMVLMLPRMFLGYK